VLPELKQTGPKKKKKKDGIDSVVRKRGLFMCRIVSLFLVQTLKGSTSDDAGDFNTIKTRDITKFFSCKARQQRKFMPF
jgi:hypothetical protein